MSITEQHDDSITLNLQPEPKLDHLITGLIFFGVLVFHLGPSVNIDRLLRFPRALHTGLRCLSKRVCPVERDWEGMAKSIVAEIGQWEHAETAYGSRKQD